MTTTQTALRFEYFVNLDERGEFRADVRDEDGETLYEIEGFEIFEDGFMRNKSDVRGLAEHLRGLGVMPAGSTLYAAN